jgi:AsmA protein
MTERKPPRDPLMPPPLPPRLDTVRPGIDRPEDRPAMLDRPAPRPLNGPLPVPSYDRDPPPVSRTSRNVAEPHGTGPGLALALTAFVVLATAGAGLAYLAFAPPTDMIRQQVIAQVKAKTGRDLTIEGGAEFALFPNLTLTLHDVTLSAPPGMGGRRS